MSFMDYCHLTKSQVVDQLETDLDQGLSEKAIQSRQEKFGLNELEEHRVFWWQVLLRQFKSSFIYLLIIAAALAFILGERIDAILIISFILINAGLGFFQEMRSETAVQSLRKYTQGRARVRRAGEEETVPSSDLVPGDIVILETGDIVPADIRLLEINHLLVDETILTGESIQISKISENLPAPVSEPYQAENIVFKGTSIINGKAEGVVVSTGKDTEFGKISKFITTTKRESAFQKNIDRISKFIIWLVAITIIIVLTIHVFLSDTPRSLIDLIVFSIALVVGVIPEALPLVTTFSLSRSAKNLAEKSVVVKRLTSIEDLGSIQILCTDKTGTITQNLLQVSARYGLAASENELAFIGSQGIRDIYDEEARPNNAFDLALISDLDATDKEKLSENELIWEIPFDPSRRRSSVLLKKGDEKVLIVRGSPEEMIPLDPTLTQQQKEKALAWIKEQGVLGRRTLAISSCQWEGGMEYLEADEEDHIRISGILAFEDQLKPTTTEIVEKAKRLGVRLVVLTGDDPVVAGAMAYQANIINDREEVITGEAFDKLSIDEKRVTLSNINVYARVSPKEKFEIIQLLQEDKLVGFLGEGINDAPALKASNVSLVVESASDIAREASDIILLENDLGVIIEGVVEGRKTFANSMTYIRATLLANFGNFFAVAFASLIIPYLPMLPVQILLVNLLSDFPMFSISTDNVSTDELQRPKQYNPRSIIIIASLLGIVSTLFDFIIFGVFQRFGEGRLQTYWFIGSILTELVLLFSIRTKRVFYKADTKPSKEIVIFSVLAFLVTIILPFTQIGAQWFHFVRPAWSNLGVLMLIVVGYFVATEIVKHLYFKYIEN